VSYTVFVASKFSNKHNNIIDSIVGALERTSKVLGLDIVPLRQDVLYEKNITVGDLREFIGSADMVIADVSSENQSIVWEIGYAQALNKPTLLLTDDSSKIPNEMRDKQYILFDHKQSLSGISAKITDILINIIGLQTGKIEENPAFVDHRKVFISYSHADQEYLHRILVHLRPLERKGLIYFWSDKSIRPGDNWREEIKASLQNARIAVLLISADFLASEFIVANELPPLLFSAQEKGIRIMPVIIKPSRFMRDDNLSKFQAINDPNRPVITMNEAEREALYAQLAEHIEHEFQL
jgi:TIR domain./Nucleoside 2-deoxyribosyltransferase.